MPAGNPTTAFLCNLYQVILKSGKITGNNKGAKGADRQVQSFVKIVINIYEIS